MASEAERDGFGGAISSAAAPAVSLWLPFWSWMEVNDSWTARILAILVPIGLVVFSIIVAMVIVYLCDLLTVYRMVALHVDAFVRVLNGNEVPALE